MKEQIDIKLNIDKLKVAQIASVAFLVLLVICLFLVACFIPFVAWLFKAVFALIGLFVGFGLVLYGLGFAINVLFVHSSDEKEWPGAFLFKK